MKQSKTNIENKIETAGVVAFFIGFIIMAGESDSVSLETFVKIKLAGIVIMGIGALIIKIAEIIRKEKYEQNRGLYNRQRRNWRN